jgi:hypothetical protein
LTVLPAPAFADGKAFSVTSAPPTMPDQRALIVWDGAVETLLIDTTIEGAEGAAAWVVPVPAEPEVFEVDRGLFNTVQVAFQPRVLDRTASLALAAVGLAWIASVILLVARCRASGEKGSLAGGLAIALLGLLVVALFMPALGTARGTGRAPALDDEAPVQSRRQVGLYDVAVLQGADASGIAAWLEREGFAIDRASREAIAAYVTEGWWFVASKLAPESVHPGADVGPAGGPSDTPIAPHPLGLRFASTEAVYPMRLTGTQSRDLRVELFVFADRMAGAPGLRPIRCSKTELLPAPDTDSGGPMPERQVFWPRESIPVGHAQLRELIGAATVATRLAATLSPAQMRGDLWLNWSEPSPRGEAVISQGRAIARAMTAASAMLVAGSIAMLCIWTPRKPRRTGAHIGIAVLLLAPATVGGVTWLADSGVATKHGVWPIAVGIDHERLYNRLRDAIRGYADAHPEWAGPTSPADAEAWLRQRLHDLAEGAFHSRAEPWWNAITASPMREIAEPGGFRLWHDESRVWYSYYDLAGQETSQIIWFRSDAPELAPGGG